MTFIPGKYVVGNINGPVSVTKLVFDALGDPNAQFIISATTIDFLNYITLTNITSIELLNGASNCNIFWLSHAITFTGTLPPSIPGILISTSDSITFNALANVSGRIYSYGNGIIDFFDAENKVDGTCVKAPIVCYVKDTLILTENGYIPIQNIKVGDNIITKGKIYKNSYINKKDNIKSEKVIWISKFKVSDMNTESRPVCIKSWALGYNLPFKDLYVSPNHSVLISNKGIKHNYLIRGRMVPARRLINGRTIYQDNNCEEVEYYHIECKEHMAIIANGILSESYLDVNNRYVFEKQENLEKVVTPLNIDIMI